MEVNDLKIFQIDITFYHWHVQKVVFNVLTKMKKNEDNRDWRLKG